MSLVLAVGRPAADPERRRGALAAAPRAAAPRLPRGQPDPAAHRLALRCSTEASTAARETPPLTTFAAMLVGLLLGRRARVAGLAGAAVAPRPRRAARGAPDEASTAAELRARAERALAEGRYADALVDAFRAAGRSPGRARPHRRRARRDGARGRGAPWPRRSPSRRPTSTAAPRLFDLVSTAAGPPPRDQAVDVLGLDERLAARRERRRRHRRRRADQPAAPAAGDATASLSSWPALAAAVVVVAAGGRPPGDRRRRSTPTTPEPTAPGRWPGCSTTRAST